MPVAVENRLVRFNQDREQIVDLVVRRIFDRLTTGARNGSDKALEYVINDVAYQEMNRLAGATGRRGRLDYARWRDLAAKLGAMSEQETRACLLDLLRYYARDIVGNFDPRVYRLASGLVPAALGFAFTPMRRPLAFDGISRLAQRVQVEGPIDLIKDCCRRGTIIIAPTHSSNMDSLVLGFALLQAGLPPMTYGAGKNLFTNPLISFFMHNLGAYRVDRRLRFALYKDVLKEYSTVLLEHGYHSLFFPGGTRCRSNRVESKLKLGLLGTGLQAFRNTLQRFYIVPATINYHLVLEAETLVDDHLAEEGKARYIIEDDEFTRVGRIAEFLRRTLALEESVVVRFGRPLDVLGHDVDDDGESLDRRGRRVEPASYLQGADGVLTADHQRDATYTCDLGRRLVAAFRRETVFLSSHLTSRVLFDAVVRRARTSDVYRLLRVPLRELDVPLAEIFAGISRLRKAIADRPDVGQVHDRIRTSAAEDIVDVALRALGIYHTHGIARRDGATIRIDSPRLLYFYGNRTGHLEAY
jgi:glycerol-3-phosphate O-acyltransferase